MQLFTLCLVVGKQNKNKQRNLRLSVLKLLVPIAQLKLLSFVPFERLDYRDSIARKNYLRTNAFRYELRQIDNWDERKKKVYEKSC